ncbi:GFA family protein [Pseudomonas sp.]|uniref:GFA family protein n=1 Tax=Pseudomonas sp. TaxID=306 RepID=UPI0032426EF0
MFELLSEPKATTHCHCRMCQKQHDAAFATYASLPASDLRYLSGEDCLSRYNSSDRVVRTFCRICGSSLTWSGSKQFADWVSVAVATLDTPFSPKSIRQSHTDSRACWLESSQGTEA